MTSIALEPIAAPAPGAPRELSPSDLECWNRQGYLLAKGLFTPAEVAAIARRFEGIGRGQPIPGHWEPKGETDRGLGTALSRWPRVMHPHRFDELSKHMMLHPRVGRTLEQLMGEPAVACQSMFYFKPPGAKGQALHQDNFYLKVMPGTCVAAWTAIDPATPENGGMYVVPTTHTMDIVCPEVADADESFTTHLTRVPAGLKAVPAVMEPGDTLFFNGSLIHGSGPNRHASLWRRAFICHYMPSSTTHVSRGYFPIHDFAGNVIEYQASAGGGPCGEAFKDYVSYDQVH